MMTGITTFFSFFPLLNCPNLCFNRTRGILGCCCPLLFPLYAADWVGVCGGVFGFFFVVVVVDLFQFTKEQQSQIGEVRT